MFWIRDPFLDLETLLHSNSMSNLKTRNIHMYACIHALSVKKFCESRGVGVGIAMKPVVLYCL